MKIPISIAYLVLAFSAVTLASGQTVDEVAPHLIHPKDLIEFSSAPGGTIMTPVKCVQDGSVYYRTYRSGDAMGGNCSP